MTCSRLGSGHTRLGRGLAAVAFVLLAAASATAQVAQVGPFEVGQVGSAPDERRTRSVDVAVGVDGTITFFGDAVPASPIYDVAVRYVRRFAPDGTPLGPVHGDGVPNTAPLGPRIAAPLFFDPTHPELGYPYAIAFERFGGGFYGEVLFSNEALFYAHQETRILGNRGPDRVPAAVAMRSDIRPVWVTWIAQDDAIRVLDTGAPFGFRTFIVEQDPAVRALAIVPLPDRSYVIGWGSDESPVSPSARVARYRHPAQPPAFGPTDLSTDTVLESLAVSADGATLAYVGTRPRGTSARHEVWAGRITPDGAPIGPEFLVHAAAPGVRVAPDLEFDARGNLYVAWTEGDTALRGRAFDGANVPQGGAVTFVDGAAVGRAVRLARLPDGTIANAWAPWDGTTAYGMVASLCRPSVICGDGTLDPYCETCDDPAGNSDVIPDRCRIDCRPPRCNDGVTDADEECDDGNATDCDGCDAACRLEVGLGCGDGIPYPQCGETCDDQNAAAGDGCADGCVLERVLGGGSARTDCVTEWSVNNPTNVPLLDARGGFSSRQTCRDGDPLCDFDGAVNERCTFRVRTCANNTDSAACASPRLAAWLLTSPSAAKAARDPVAAAVRAALLGTVPGAIVGPSIPDVCSAETELVVPMNGPGIGKLTIKTRATLYDGTKDNDKMTFTCVR